MKRWKTMLRLASVAILLLMLTFGGAVVAKADDPPKDITTPGAVAPPAPR